MNMKDISISEELSGVLEELDAKVKKHQQALVLNVIDETQALINAILPAEKKGELNPLVFELICSVQSTTELRKAYEDRGEVVEVPNYDQKAATALRNKIARAVVRAMEKRGERHGNGGDGKDAHDEAKKQ